MQHNHFFHLSLLTVLLGIPTGVISLQESAIAQQYSDLDFRNIRFSSVGMRTLISGSATTTITLSVQNDGPNNRSFNYSESQSLSRILLVDSKNNGYFGQFEDGLDKPFFSGENRLVKLKFSHPMGIYPSYLQLDSGDPNKPIYIRF